MSYSFISNIAAGSTDASTILTPSIDTTGANLIAIFVCNAGTGFTVSDNKSNTYNPRTQYDHIPANVASQWFYCEFPTVGTGHTFSLSGGVAPSMEVLAFSGGKTASFDQENGFGATGNTTLQPGSVTPSEDNELLLCGVTIQGGTTAATIDSGFTKTDQVDFSGGQHYGSAAAYLIQTAASAINPTWTMSTADLASTSIATFKVGGPVIITQNNAIFFASGTTA